LFVHQKISDLLILSVAAEYSGLRGDAIGKLRQEGVQVTEEREENLFVFCGDTTTECFVKSPQILKYPVVIVECSFLLEEEAQKAADSKHTLWRDLKPIVEAHPETKFVLIHFSMRYQSQEIRDFFAKQNLKNVHIMLQGFLFPFVFFVMNDDLVKMTATILAQLLVGNSGKLR
jgi:hypothetical protein